MRDTWLHDHLGEEARPTPRFEAQLADTLHAAWIDPQAVAVSPQQPAAPRRTLRPWLAAAAAVAVFGAGGIYLATDDGKPQITGESTVMTLAPSTSVDATDPTSTTPPSTTVTEPGAIDQVTVTIDDTTRRFVPVELSTVPDVNAAAVLPSGRTFVGTGSNLPEDTTFGPTSAISEVLGTFTVPTNLTVHGALRVGLDERLYVLDYEAGEVQAYREEAPQQWVLDETMPLLGEGACRLSPATFECGGNELTMQSPVPAAEIDFGADLSITATTADDVHRWQLTLAGPTVSLGDCVDDMCLVNRPYGPDGVLWTPFLDGTDERVVVALRPGEAPVVGLLPCNADCSIIGVSARSVYFLATTGDGMQLQRVDLVDPISVTAATPEEQTVLDYLAALTQGRWTDAARLLGEGGQNWEERSDLRPLMNDAGTFPNLAASLQAWCASPAMCTLPTALTTVDNWVVASFTIDGVVRSSIFFGGTYEGSPTVYGLPLRLPPAGVSLADTVACPVAGVEYTAYADLDGDGWAELIVAIQDESSVRTLLVCGTQLVVSPIGNPNAAGLWALDIEGDGVDELLTGGFSVDTFYGAVIRWDGTALTSTGQQVTRSNPIDGNPGTSFGCEDMAGVGRGLVQYSYQYEGGTDLSNSTALTFTRTILNADGTVNPVPLPLGRYELPAQEQKAFRLIASYCGNLPVQTG